MVGAHWAWGTVRSHCCRRGRGSLPVGAREAPLRPAYTVNVLLPELDREQAWTSGSAGVPRLQPQAPAGGPVSSPHPQCSAAPSPLPSCSAEGAAQGHCDL